MTIQLAWVKTQKFNPVTYADEARNRRARMMARAKADQQAEAPVVKETPVVVSAAQSKRIELQNHQADLMAALTAQFCRPEVDMVALLDNPNCSPVNFIKAKCAQYGVFHADIMSGSRVPDVVDARMQIVADLHERYPEMTMSKIGRLMNRNHSVIIKMLRRYGRTTAPAPQKLSEEQKAAILEMVDRGLMMKTIAAIFGIDAATVSKIRNKREDRTHAE